ncbi:pilus assembly protein PilO [Methyloglobulus morosus KoM1]|uniref:Pilus assembly protein PilO n=1 Tax=Methyloglobulus morosus KoM1 TaxID=1116472 RepID=V5C3G0_9GAMM|nr:type 4a pilus biogenesis protein PilO [Methyloglobulus morosus]ESS71358.1 pilus assembly protein PilO [Methyloglobulus morosus KoM1]
MNLSEINWDINASGTWPFPVKVAIAALICIVVGAAGFYLDTAGQIEELEALEKQEVDLKSDFESKQKKAANLQDYRDQLAQIETSLAIMIKQMPTKEEVASLLVDISQTGLASGLEFRLFRPGAPIARDFYSELPINIQVVGKYEELSLFVSGLAALPRIVTVHDVKISPVGKDDTMLMDATVKTYNEQLTEVSTPGVRTRGGK